MSKPKTKTVSRSAVTGKFVKDSFRKTHPSTTIRQRIKIGK